ncbi:uncharacterized protein [Amphiura filiformis]|uniref:uncharacterized protein isoform X2 n=1 Tax=Amphiura filiformis TaxID=82378 RepID=UPI003B217662
MNKLIIIAILTVFVTHAMLTAEASDCEVQGVVYSNGDPIPSDNPYLCPSGEPWHRCSGDLCEGKTCHVPGATCVPDQCGGCDSYFVRQNGTKIKKCNKNRK